MAGHNEYVYNIEYEDFEQKVIKASHHKVVVVDFWADWCAPCKMLGPILEKVISTFKGRVILAKVNVDMNRELAMGYRVQSIPSVKIFSNGSVVDEFVGVISESEVASRIAAVVGNEYETMVRRAHSFLMQEHLSEAESLYKAVLAKVPDHSGALIGLARVEIMNGNTVLAKEFLSKVDEFDKRHEEAKSLLDILDFIKVCTEAGGIKACRKKVQKNPDDLNALHDLGSCYAADGMFEEALKTFLSIVKRNSTFDNGKSHKAMLTIFNIIGQDSDLTGKYRDLLARALF
jgi:putative thioredoxin